MQRVGKVEDQKERHERWQASLGMAWHGEELGPPAYVARRFGQSSAARGTREEHELVTAKSRRPNSYYPN